MRSLKLRNVSGRGSRVEAVIFLLDRGFIEEKLVDRSHLISADFEVRRHLQQYLDIAKHLLVDALGIGQFSVPQDLRDFRLS